MPTRPPNQCGAEARHERRPAAAESGGFGHAHEGYPPPRRQGGLSTAPKTRASVRHSSRRRADDLRSSREVARAAADPFVTSSFHKQAMSTPLKTQRLQSIVRPSRARPRHRKCSAHAHATGGPRATRRAGSVWQGGGNLPRWRRRAAVTLATTTEFRFTSLWVRKRRTVGNF